MMRPVSLLRPASSSVRGAAAASLLPLRHRTTATTSSSTVLSSSSPSASSCFSGNAVLVGAQLTHSARHISSYGRITDEDRRWWLIHLECSPDVNAGTFVSWLDNCGTHTTKKLIERDIWTVEQVANLSSDQVDELRYKEGCVHMDVVWEHARTVLVPLKSRQQGMSAEASSLQDRILELRKKRELERRREEIVKERSDTVQSREETLQKLREQVEKKRQALREQQMRWQQQQEGGGGAEGEEEDDDDDGEEEDDDEGEEEDADAEKIIDELGKPKPPSQ